jgi:thiol-disulfide isomerase/thioredoxin
MSVPMIVARVAVSPRVAETHSARASRHAAGSVYDFSSRAPSGLASVRAPRTTRWRATHASSSPSSPGARGETRRQTIHRAFAITSAGAAVGSRVDQRSRSTDQTEAETRNVAERNPSSATERARRRMEQTIANGNETDEQKISATTTTTRPEPELVSLPSGGSVAPWWAHGSDLANVADVRSAEEYVARMEEAKAMSLSRRKSGDSSKPLLVCVEFLAGWCFACRSLHPKMTKIASEEFNDVLFLRVRKDECPALCDAMGIEKLPYVHLVSPLGESRDGAEIVDAFAVNLTAPKLAKLRAGLRAHSTSTGVSDRREPVAWRGKHHDT